MIFDPFNLLLLAIAVVIFWRLKSVLGSRTGSERPPTDSYGLGKKVAAPPAPEGPRPADLRLPPSAGDDKARQADEPPPPPWRGYAADGSPLAEAIGRLAAADQSFSPKPFLDGAKIAYEMIVEAFAKGDKAALKDLLARDVFASFAGAIDARAAAGQKIEQRFVGIRKADLTAVVLAGGKAQVAVKFVSDIISATLDRDGGVAEGDKTQIREVTDIWTFEREPASRDPNWRLVATQAEA